MGRSVGWSVALCTLAVMVSNEEKDDGEGWNSELPEIKYTSVSTDSRNQGAVAMNGRADV